MSRTQGVGRLAPRGTAGGHGSFREPGRATAWLCVTIPARRGAGQASSARSVAWLVDEAASFVRPPEGKAGSFAYEPLKKRRRLTRHPPEELDDAIAKQHKP